MPDFLDRSHSSKLAAVVDELCPCEGSHATAIPGLYLTRSSRAEVPRTTLDRAVLCVVAQGSKSTISDGQRHVYDTSRYLLVSLDLPLVGQIEEASHARPFLGVSLVLDVEEIRELIRTAELTQAPERAMRSSLVVGSMDEAMLDAVTRLTRLLQTPAEAPVLAPLVRREIYYRLLLNDESGLLARMVAEDSKTKRIAAGLEWLRRNAARPIRMEELARELGMSSSTMHSWFRSVTSMSPLQFQKQLRLQEARRLMLSEAIDANAAGRRVGYESASQFTREYRRFFGAPPMRDVEQLRMHAGPSA